MRKSRAKKRILLPDPKFNDVLVTRFVNNLMYDGKKSISYDLFYDAIEIVQKRNPDVDGLETFKNCAAALDKMENTELAYLKSVNSLGNSVVIYTYLMNSL